MDNVKEDILTREEYVRLAKQSCMKNLSERSAEGAVKSGKLSLVKKSYGDDYYNSMDLGQLEENGVGLPVSKKLLIKIICISTVFLFVVVLDWFNLSYDKINSASIEKVITDQDYFNTAQEYMASLIEDIVSNNKNME